MSLLLAYADWYNAHFNNLSLNMNKIFLMYKYIPSKKSDLNIHIKYGYVIHKNF